MNYLLRKNGGKFVDIRNRKNEIKSVTARASSRFMGGGGAQAGAVSFRFRKRFGVTPPIVLQYPVARQNTFER